MERVLVTGATGFIALHCIQQLLDMGYQVRGTLRSEKRKSEVRDAMQKHSSNHENLELVMTDLLNDEGWDEAVEGCDYVLHVASPFVLIEPDNEDDLIKPAVEGSLRVLRTCSGTNVKKVVLTSSFAAIGYGHDKEIYDETDWSIPSTANGTIGAYATSKTNAEKAAWDYVSDLSEKDKFDFTVINPVAVTGPMLSEDIGTSNSMFIQLCDGSMPACPRIHIGFVDVRDVAKAHIFAMKSEATNSERIIVSQKEMFFSELGQVLRNAGYKKAPTREMPNFLVKFLALFIKELGGLKRSLGHTVFADKSKAKKLFNWEYVSAEDSAIETAEQLQSMGLISK